VSRRLTISAFVSGALFAAGLGLAGMTRPGKVIGFLDFFGDWDPSLMLVMAGAIGVYAPAARLAKARSAPYWGRIFALPTRTDIDPKLLLGSALFGLGWGLAGYCPGPGLVSAGAGLAEGSLFVVAMLSGMAVHRVAFGPPLQLRARRVDRPLES
jgi:uncharacterized membrane protein YedE/YeeE